jgi:DNA-binding NarL/FixJ family response regulator
VDCVTVRVVSGHPIATAEYCRLLSASGTFRLVNGAEAAQVGVFDAEGPSVEATLGRALIRWPSMRPLLLAPAYGEEAVCALWIRLGVWGLVTYDRYEQDLPWAVRQVAAGQLFFPAAVVMSWMRDHASSRASALRFPLTPREREVMEFLLRGGLSNKEIATTLRISERTVKFHVGNIFCKLHVSSRRQLLEEPRPAVRSA